MSRPTPLRRQAAAGWAGLALLAGLATAQPIQPVASVRIGNAPNDTIEDAAVGRDGTLYVAGTIAQPLEGRGVITSGRPAVDTDDGAGFVARLDDGGRVRAAHQFAPGLLHATTVVVAEAGVYVGGYATPGLAEQLRPLGGWRVDIVDAQRQIPHVVPPDHWTDDRIAERRDVRGVPVVLRFSHDLVSLEAGTALEGWQSVWHVPRPLDEDRWQPVGLAIMDDGDVVVAHDGGYVRAPAAGRPPSVGEFYGVADHLSRLSPDLSRRRWTRRIETPPVDPTRASRILGFDWSANTLGNTRTLRMRGDGEHVYLAGWSPTRTSGEPWWSTFLWKVDDEGQTVWRAYNPDPQSGKGERMGGLVADSAIRSVWVGRRPEPADAPTRVLFAGISDGGNTVLRRDPRDYHEPAGKMRGDPWGFGGRTLFWGVAGALRPDDAALLAGNAIHGRDPDSRRVTAAWPIDLAGLDDGGAIVAGRQTTGFRFTADAASTEPGCGFVSLCDASFAPRYATALPGMKPMSLAHAGRTVVIVGQALEGGVNVAVLRLADAPPRE